MYKKRLRQLGVLRPEKAKGRGKGDLITIFYCSVGGNGEDAAQLLGHA